jgi:GAF domain-containing protein
VAWRGDGFAEEQAALRRVAVLVARAASSEEVFAAISAEVGQVLGADFTVLSRYDADGTATVLGTWAGSGATLPYPDGTRFAHTGRSVHRMVFVSFCSELM